MDRPSILAYLLRMLRTIAILALALGATFLLIRHLAKGAAPNGRLAKDYIGSLRRELSQSQLEYGLAFGPDANLARDAVARVRSLRGELKQALPGSLDQATGSDSLLAIHRANTESILEVIHAYEAAIGQPPGSRTTPWNISSSEELDTLRAQALDSLSKVQKSVDALGALERPPFLLGRQSEITSWIAGIEREQALRAAGAARAPHEIDSSISLSEARTRFSAISAAERRLGGSFEKHLSFQIELRLGNSPRDAALLALRDRLPIRPWAGAVSEQVVSETHRFGSDRMRDGVFCYQ